MVAAPRRRAALGTDLSPACQTGTEDGYDPGPGDHSCATYASDYNPQDWTISLSELLRVIQFYNSLGYRYCPAEATEDGYCPGA